MLTNRTQRNHGLTTYKCGECGYIIQVKQPLTAVQKRISGCPACNATGKWREVERQPENMVVTK